MTMKRYLDIHSHTRSADPDTWTLRNVYQDFDTLASDEICSVGLHPWYLDNWSNEIDIIRTLASMPNIPAIGECGLDTLCTTPMDMQIDAFQRQIDIANSINKPLIIHCVRAFSETLKILEQANIPAIFHGFVKNPALATELLHHGHYLSFGAALTEGKKNAIDSLVMVPADRFFLETDDSNVPIQAIYQAAAAIRNISEDALVDQIHKNFQTVFTL